MAVIKMADHAVKIYKRGGVHVIHTANMQKQQWKTIYESG